MTTSVMCSRCGTRNRAAMGLCRRCKTPLSGNAIANHRTERGTPTSELIEERWAPLGPIAGMSRRFSRAKDVATGQEVLLEEIPWSSSQESVEAVTDRVRRRQDVQAVGLLPVTATKVSQEAILMVMPMMEGEPLSRLLSRRDGIPLPVVMQFFQGLIIGVEALHDHGLCHGRIVADAVWIGTEGSGGQAAGRLSGGTEDFSEEGARDDYRALAKIVAAMLIGSAHGQFEGTGEAIGAAIHRTSLRAGEAVTACLRRLFDILVRSDGQTPVHRRSELIDEVLRAMGTSVENAMVSVDRGPFQRGSSDSDPQGRPEEKPTMMIDVGAFFIDRTPVTVRQYGRYLEATNQAPPPGWESVNPQEGEQADRPVVFVSWQEARDYARWAGKRLATEAEWEKAARFTDGRLYPWGNSAPDPTLACFGGANSPEPVGRRPLAASEYGVLDMAGNVFEWVQDWFDADYYERAPLSNPRGPDEGTKKVLRGGSFAHSAFALRCATRGRYAPGERRTNHSFRCVWSVRDPFDDNS